MNEHSKQFNREVQAFIQNVCAKNMLQIYDINGEFWKFDYQRHICQSLQQVPGTAHADKVINSIVAALHLGLLWAIHLQKSNYPLSWFTCIQVEKEWFQQKRGRKGPAPYVVLSVEADAVKVRDNPAFKIWTGQHTIIKEALDRSGLQGRMRVYFDEIHGIIRFVPVIVDSILNKDFILEIRDCIKRDDWQALVDNGGLEWYLLPRWENFVHSLPKNPSYLFDEYLNDVSKRETIAKIIQKCGVASELLIRLANTDKLFINKTLETNVCIWCDYDDMTDLYPKSQWYYYRIPPERIECWSNDIRWLKEVAEKRGLSLFCENELNSGGIE